MPNETAARGYSAPYHKSVTFRLPRRSAVPAAAETCVEHLFFAPVRDGVCAAYGTYSVFILYSYMDERAGLICAQTAVRQMFTLPVTCESGGAQPTQAYFEPRAALRPGVLRGTWTVDIAAEARLLFDGAYEAVELPPALDAEPFSDMAEVTLRAPNPPVEEARPALPPRAAALEKSSAPHKQAPSPAPQPPRQEETAVHCWRVRGGQMPADLLLEMPDAQRGDFTEQMS